MKNNRLVERHARKTSSNLSKPRQVFRRRWVPSRLCNNKLQAKKLLPQQPLLPQVTLPPRRRHQLLLALQLKSPPKVRLLPLLVQDLKAIVSEEGRALAAI